MPGIYLKPGDGDYIAMTEAAYDAEKVLQRTIARHPEIEEEPGTWSLGQRLDAVAVRAAGLSL